MKALEKDRRRRYETANGLARDIERHLANEPVHARPASKSYRFRRLIQRNQLAFMAAAVVTVSVLAGLGFSTWSFLRAQAALNDLAGTAPEFVARARELFREEQFDEAIRKADFAIALDPHRMEFRLAKADLLEALLKFGEARKIYKEVLASEPENDRAARHAKLCEGLERERKTDGTFAPQALSKLIAAIAAEGRSAAEQLPASRLLGAQSEPFRQLWLDRLRVLPVQGKPLDERLHLLPNGSFELNLGGLPVSELSPLAGMPLEALDLSHTRVTNLQDLAGLQLRKLNLAGTPVTDLSPLAQVPIEWLDISVTGVASLEPLRGMPLRVLHARACPIADLAPLAGLPLVEFHLGNATCTSLAPLAGAPLRELILESVPITDLAPLAATRIEMLDLSAIPISDVSALTRLPLKKIALRRAPLPVNLHPLGTCTSLEDLIAPLESEGFAELRALPALMRISAPLDEGWPEAPAAEFWKRWAPLNAALERIRPHVRTRVVRGAWESGTVRAVQRRTTTLVQLNRDDTIDVELSGAGLDNIEFLRGLPLRDVILYGNPINDLTPLAGMKLRVLDVESTSVSDLSPLRGMPLEELFCGSTEVRDLSPLLGMPLRTLVVWNTQVADLAPLAGMPLQLVSIAGTSVRDLSPLRGMPLRTIHLNECGELHDLSPLLDCPYLRELLLPPHPANISGFRRHASLRYISFTYNWPAALPAQTAKSFWARIDGGLDPVAVSQELAVAFKVTEPIAVTLRPDQTLDIDLSKRPISDLTPLDGLKIGKLNLAQTGTRDLAPLRGMPLRELILADSLVTDLAPLIGAPLQRFDAERTPIASLEPLRGMALEDLRIAGTQVHDLGPVAGMPLNLLFCGNTKVSDLKPLHGMPLRELNLWRSAVTDLSPLSGSHLAKLSISETKVSDLAPLRGVPLRNLDCWRAPVRDLAPLAEMPLRELIVSSTEVTDLAPLRSLGLETLHLEQTAIKDIEPLAAMPLRELFMDRCAGLTDLSPLRGLRTLERVTLPPHPADISLLREIPSIHELAWASDPKTNRPVQTAKQFWQEFDARKVP